MSNKITTDQVKAVAKLARLEFSENEIDQLSDQLSTIIGYVEKMNELNTENIEPLAHSLPVSNRFRQDKALPSLGTGKTLSNAPASDDDYFKVPKILDDGGGSL